MININKERIEELEEEIYLLTSNFKSSTPTIFVLVDEIIDKLILLKNLLLDDTLSEARNPVLIFLNFVQDILGNPQQVTIKDSRRIIKDEELSDLVKEMIILLIEFKRSDRHLHDNDLVTQIKNYSHKLKRRNSYTHAQIESFLNFLQNDCGGYKDRQAVLRFLKWYNHHSL